MYIHKCTKKFELRVKLISADANYSFDFGQRLMGSIFCSGLTDNSYEIIQLVVMRREKFTSIFRANLISQKKYWSKKKQKTRRFSANVAEFLVYIHRYANALTFQIQKSSPAIT